MDINHLRNEIDICRRQKMKWATISSKYGISRDRLYHWRKATNYEDPLSNATDEQLLTLVYRFMAENNKRCNKSMVATLFIPSTNE